MDHELDVPDRGGRLIVVATPAGLAAGEEPRRRIGRVGAAAVPIAAVDVSAAQLTSSRPVTVDETSAAFPMANLADLPADDYRVQAVLDLSHDLRLTDAPGNLFSLTRRVAIDPTRRQTITLRLTEMIPEAPASPASPHVRFVRIRSGRLSAFHGRPIDLRAGVILPVGFDAEPERRYPLRISIGGYGQRYTAADRLMGPGSRFREIWLADDTPRMLRVVLDGAGPYGDPYQVNSANNGPYGDAVTQELIPHIEERFRGVGRPRARVLDGSSTGGWVALALQIFYPDLFNGAWSSCPDAVDFRAFQRVDVYDDDNAYVDADGEERPSRRSTDGTVRFTMRHELGMENVLGHGDSWSRSGRQWGAWNAVYGPQGRDGRPRPLWDPRTGVIDREVTTAWERYDLRLVLARQWETLRPKLDGKLTIWVGEMDDYYLNEAVHLLDDFLRETDPSFRARIAYGPGRGHCWRAAGERELLRQMGRRMRATR